MTSCLGGGPAVSVDPGVAQEYLVGQSLVLVQDVNLQDVAELLRLGRQVRERMVLAGAEEEDKEVFLSQPGPQSLPVGEVIDGGGGHHHVLLLTPPARAERHDHTELNMS